MFVQEYYWHRWYVCHLNLESGAASPTALSKYNTIIKYSVWNGHCYCSGTIQDWKMLREIVPKEVSLDAAAEDRDLTALCPANCVMVQKPSILTEFLYSSYMVSTGNWIVFLLVSDPPPLHSYWAAIPLIHRLYQYVLKMTSTLLMKVRVFVKLVQQTDVWLLTFVGVCLQVMWGYVNWWRVLCHTV